MGLFGSSGVRGVVNQEMTPELALNIGMAAGSIAKSAVLGFDSRTSNDMMSAAVSSGLMACGCEVYTAGFVTTPTLAEAARGHDCGVMLTASHNPPQYAGVKLWNPDGMGFGIEQSAQIEQMIDEGKYSAKPWNLVGSSHVFADAVENHLDRIMGGVGSAGLKVVVDCANGPALTITPLVLQEMGCRVVTINSNRDGRFPGRMPEPTDENLSDLKGAVLSMGADLGIAHDGDADRMIAVDEKGVTLSGDELLALFAGRHASEQVVASVDASMALDDFIDAEVVRTRVGDVFVSEEVKRTGADFGGEPSGTWIFPDQTYCPDGVLAAARMAEMVASEKLSKLRESVPRYPTRRIAIDYPLAMKAEVLECLREEMTGIECDELLTLDGYRLGFEDGWTLVRPSGTEPKIRIVAEARDAVRAEELLSVMVDKVKGCIK